MMTDDDVGFDDLFFRKKKKKTRFGLFAPVSSEMEKTWYSQIENQS